MKKSVIIMILVVVLITFVPIFALRGAEFEGSDDAGSEMVREIAGEEHEPWFEPILEILIGGEIPGEIETLIFCIQTGIGVGVLAYWFGYLVSRKKYSRAKNGQDKSEAENLLSV